MGGGLVAAVVVAAMVGACSPSNQGSSSGSAAASSSASASASVGQGSTRQPKSNESFTRQGSGVALVSSDRAVIADEDHEVLFVVPTSLDEAVKVVALPGPPAQVVVRGDVVLVTIRTLPAADAKAAREAVRGELPASANVKSLPETNPTERAKLETRPPYKRGTPLAAFDPAVVRKSQGGLLLAFAWEPNGSLKEVGRVTLAPDAWGIALTADDARAVVTSAWSHRVTVVDVRDPAKMSVVAELVVGREPRGVVITADGSTAFVSHLVGSALTRIDDLGKTPVAKTQPLPPALARGPQGRELHATLAYAPLISPDGRTLFVPRHAIGAEGNGSWWGATTVDTMDVATGAPLQPVHIEGSPRQTASAEYMRPTPDWRGLAGRAPRARDELVQPRAAAYRKSTDSILVLSEGWDAVVELDARAPDPAMAPISVMHLGQAYDAFGHFPEHGGAPSAIALDRDEAVAYVFCRSTFDLARIDLATKKVRWLHLAEDGLPADAAYGRRLFYSASSKHISGGLACSACHPDGRDDGYTWREGNLHREERDPLRFVASRELVKLRTNEPGDKAPAYQLHPRHTPMIAGRVRANGPYGWHGREADLGARLLEGFELHRGGWESALNGSSDVPGEMTAKIEYLADFLRMGLLPPPTLDGPLSEQEKQGEALFSGKAQCGTCHVGTELTDRKVPQVRSLPTRAGFDHEADQAFRTPSLWFVGETAPYFHDGSAATLEDLVRDNGTRMGNSAALSADERAALVAYLRTL